VTSSRLNADGTSSRGAAVVNEWNGPERFAAERGVHSQSLASVFISSSGAWTEPEIYCRLDPVENRFS